MTDRDYTDETGRRELTERDLAVATLVGRYVERREQNVTPDVHDLLAAAAEFGDAAVDELCAVLTFYEEMRACEISDPTTPEAKRCRP